jgi:response regulator RpfG family c-di-GMP phosphodiesterase
MSTAMKLRILIIEDSENDAFLLLREMRRLGYDVESRRVETEAEVRSALANQEWDLIVCDYSLPHLDANQALKILKSTGLDLPFLIMSGTIDEENAVNALKAGAHDFLVKGKFARLGPAIERELRDAQVRKEHRRAEESLREKERLLSESQRVGHIGSWSFDLTSNKLQFSEEMYRLLDVSPHDFAHTSDALVGLVFAPDRPMVAQWLDDIKNARPNRELDFRILFQNDELRYFQCRGAFVYDSAAQPVRFVGTAQDVSERKLSEIQIRQQIARLTALRNIDLAITSSFNLQFALGSVLSETVNQLQVDAAAILLLQSEQQTLTYAAIRGFRAHETTGKIIPVDESYAGQAVNKRRMIRIENLQEKPDGQAATELLEKEGFVTYFGVPLISKGKVLGVLEVFHRVALTPYPEWLEFLETIAGQAAIAVDNFTLFENLQKSNLELQQAYDATIEGWSHALDLRDKETEGHTQRVTEMSQRLARIMGLKGETLLHMRRGALLHDIGKMGVPDSILLKPSEFTREEWEIMSKHPQLAYDWLKPIAYLKEALVIPYCHHERWDGSGYPRGLKGEEIPLTARIFTVVDEWDAITSDRPYRTAWPQEKAVEYIRESSGTHFDPDIVEVFLNNLEKIIYNDP